MHFTVEFSKFIFALYMQLLYKYNFGAQVKSLHIKYAFANVITRSPVYLALSSLLLNPYSPP